MVLCSRKIAAQRKHVCIQAGEFVIKPTESETLLGGNLHQSLQWNHHLRDGKKSLMRQLTGRINALKKVSQSCSFPTRLMVTNGVYISKVMYLMTLWGGAQLYLLKALQVQQPGGCVGSLARGGPRQSCSRRWTGCPLGSLSTSTKYYRPSRLLNQVNLLLYTRPSLPNTHMDLGEQQLEI